MQHRQHMSLLLLYRQLQHKRLCLHLLLLPYLLLQVFNLLLRLFLHLHTQSHDSLLQLHLLRLLPQCLMFNNRQLLLLLQLHLQLLQLPTRFLFPPQRLSSLSHHRQSPQRYNGLALERPLLQMRLWSNSAPS
jgi:hypothetical protein